ncbi:PREDICTED: NXPE family member 3-like isoform X1 [Branchiostoma belcheri]|uniref:NXPE family member 3-like isoform X1 n=1 Tax=Branchiostoma belcheri TaxID=7741 RepID=A0A6P4ZI54_BRABE|nr:PREDICTED: NXPE family member 3-like isoform X1 [Branchiostoma belcheri]
MVDMMVLQFPYQRFRIRDQDAPKPTFKLSFGPPINSCVLDGPAHISQATYPKYTQVVVLNRDRVYHQGDVLTVMVVARDRNRRKKTYGGDFFRARLVSSDRSSQASSAGHVTDYCNGIYTVQFSLYWAGNVSVSTEGICLQQSQAVWYKPQHFDTYLQCFSSLQFLHFLLLSVYLIMFFDSACTDFFCTTISSSNKTLQRNVLVLPAMWLFIHNFYSFTPVVLYQIKIQLVHPSEGVKVLQRVREVPNKRVFHCTFVNAKSHHKRQCFSSPTPRLSPQRQCDFSKPEVNGTWICQKPDKLPCSAISRCRWDSGKSWAKALRLASKEEKKLLQKPYLEMELELDPKEPIHVLEAELPTPQHLPACTWDKSAALGHWSGKVWKSSVCNVRVFGKEDIRRCLANKTVYFQGDSTIRQWSQRLQKVVPLKYDSSTMDFTALYGGDNSQWNISVRFQFQHFPLQGSAWPIFSTRPYIAETLDAEPGGPNTVIVVSLWAHFTAEPLEMIRSKLYAVRGAIHRLKRRAPGTRVFVRTGTTRNHDGGKIAFYLLGSDWLAYQITEVIREMFRADPDVVVLDTWDMSVCQPGKDNMHPDQTMVDSQLNTLFSHICPK